jgi:hypothetical protein
VLQFGLSVPAVGHQRPALGRRPVQARHLGRLQLQRPVEPVVAEQDRRPVTGPRRYSAVSGCRAPASSLPDGTMAMSRNRLAQWRHTASRASGCLWPSLSSMKWPAGNSHSTPQVNSLRAGLQRRIVIQGVDQPLVRHVPSTPPRAAATASAAPRPTRRARHGCRPGPAPSAASETSPPRQRCSAESRPTSSRKRACWAGSSGCAAAGTGRTGSLRCVGRWR